jgi:hypothetical protein
LSNGQLLNNEIDSSSGGKQSSSPDELIKETCLVDVNFNTESTTTPTEETNQNKSTQTRQKLKSAGNGRCNSRNTPKQQQDVKSDPASASNMLQNYTNSLVSNLKTAFMLFVVTLIMAIVYTPALLTSLGYINYNPLHWNIIYLNNAANPLVYSFLNANFRKSLRNRFRTCFDQIC